MIIILLGPPGSGKGTQAERVSETLKISHISTGDILRSAIANGTPLGLKVKDYVQKGELVPDEIMIGIIRERIKQKDCTKGFVLDGFPRTVQQAKELDRLFKENKLVVNKTIDINVPENILIKRFSGRRSCGQCGEIYHLTYKPPKKDNICNRCQGKLYQRPDDKPETISNRLKIYAETTKPLLDYYRNRLSAITGDKSIDDVFKEIKQELGLNDKV